MKMKRILTLATLIAAALSMQNIPLQAAGPDGNQTIPDSSRGVPENKGTTADSNTMTESNKPMPEGTRGMPDSNRSTSDGMKDIVDVASGASNFTTLVAALKAADLVATLQGPGPFTVFAPTDAAFAKLPKGTLEDLLKPANKEKLKGILTYHVVPGKVMAADVKTMQANTVNGQNLDVKVMSGGVTVNNAKVIMTDVVASNGVIHAIDTVLMPK